MLSFYFSNKIQIHDQNCPLANVICEYCNTMLIREQV